MPHPAITQVSRNAGSTFFESAKSAVVSYLKSNGDSSGEAITDAVKEAGIVPHDDRAFGAVYQKLSKAGVIIKRGFTVRVKGHGTGGAVIWGIAT